VNKGAQAIEGATAGLPAAKALNIGGRAALEGASAAGITGLQTGGDPEAMRNAAIAAGGTSAALGAAGAAMPAVKRGVSEVLGKTTGAGSTAIREAMESPSPEFTAAMRKNVNEMDILADLKGALRNVRSKRAADYRAALSQVAQNTRPLDASPLRRELLSALDDYGIRVSPEGRDLILNSTARIDPTDVLDFSRSRLSDAASQNDVKKITGDIVSWGLHPEDNTPLGLDTLKQRIGNEYSETGDARAFVDRLRSQTRQILSRVPAYNEMTKGYETASRFLDQLKDLSLDSKNPGTAIRKMTTVLNQNNDYRQMLIDALDQYTTHDLKGQVAGNALSKWMPRGIMGPATGISIIAGLAKGIITPHAAATLMLTSPRLMGETLSAMTQLRPILSGAAAVAPSVAATTQRMSDVQQPSTAQRLGQSIAQQPNQ
jgi:hypothetical protein